MLFQKLNPTTRTLPCSRSFTSPPIASSGSQPPLGGECTKSTSTGTCDETYSLTGMFTDDNTFTGTFTADFTPMSIGDCRDCLEQHASSEWLANEESCARIQRSFFIHDARREHDDWDVLGLG